MKASVLVLVVTAPLFMTACSQLGTDVQFGSLRATSAQDYTPITDGEEPQGPPNISSPEIIDDVPLAPGEVIDGDGNIVDGDGEVVVPACDAKTQVEAQLILRQEGSTNVAGANQTGANNSATIYQKGDSNTACVVQVGDNNRADVQQTGSSNFASVSQQGNGNTANIVQSGGSNSAVVIQK
ncbi:hypothetical protein B9G69_005160 [Bdellovibrio sp. SKB1291214]|uniref:hypothetical protein n=1 Tax=Bdellovibrio sp. SKB1291214 TaxID=1732569 RepID=UPI0015955633|nr:hypothetical protein [Bdellovibrio sp. SKB1291214]UYL09963.1 hypothetical protein B9G69_005160 [Bdellovibrio sp. SKB1291214]